MLKKYKKWILVLMLFFSLTSCGSSSSKEAKELLQKILQIIGIPYDVIVNVCQDDNENGFCEKLELQTKVIISPTEGEILWQKIEQSVEGRYFLETYDYTKPILLELQDANRINFNSGKFTLYFSGFKNDKQKEEKELSVLEAMIDAEHLKKEEATGLRTLENPYAQDKFYEYLFDGLETNLNRLGEREFAPHEAMTINIKKMANQLVENNITKELPIKISECTNKECIDKELNVLSAILAIDENEQITDDEERITTK